MLKSIKEKLIFTLSIVLFVWGFGQGETPGVPCMTCPEQANPIDMYVYVLMAVGVLFIAFFGKRLMKSKA